MVKWTSCLGSNEEFRVRYLVGLLMKHFMKRKGYPIGDGTRLEAGRATSLASSTLAPSAQSTIEMTKNVTTYREIRADYDRDTIVVYQAYNDAIADAAIAAGRFVKPFSFGRMTWIKPSFLWLMERSGWGKKTNQNRILAVRVNRAAWDQSLAEGVLTSYTPGVHPSADDWRTKFENASVHVQWDPERSIQGKKLEHRTIQVGIGRALIEQYASEWIVAVTDMTSLTAKIRRLRQDGEYAKAKSHLPRERVYLVNPATALRLGITTK